MSLPVYAVTWRVNKYTMYITYPSFDRRTEPPTLLELFENVQSWKDQVFISRAAVPAMVLLRIFP